MYVSTFHSIYLLSIPEENIIVLMYDDIANNKENPKKGQIFNKPNGTDVYRGVIKDYTGKEVTNQTFVDVLLGRDLNYGSGKVLKSTHRDHVFVFFSDHGGVGLVAFPSTILHATTLVETLKTMHQKRMFAKMTLYVEACESGSMFKQLPKDINIYATTASNATTSSYACYYDDYLKTFLGDVYSVKWMEDSDKENLNRETLEKQYNIVRRETNTSQVCQFGDLSIAKMKVSAFQGSAKAPLVQPVLLNDVYADRHQYYYDASLTSDLHRCGRDAVPGPEVPRIILEKRLASAANDEDKAKIEKELKTLVEGRDSLVRLTANIITMVTGDEDETRQIMSTTDKELTQFPCHKSIIEKFHDHCFNLGCNGWALRQANHFATMCELGYDPNKVILAIEQSCSGIEQSICGIH